MSNSFFDFFLKWMRNEWIWGPFYIFIFSFLIFNYGKKGYLFILFILLNFFTSDFLSSHLIKKNVKRLRPCRNEHVQNVTIRVKCGKGYSFTSSHATNHFALAMFLFLTFKKRIKYIYLLLIWAAIICLAQVYVGVHFPLDVFCGSILGMIVATMWHKILFKFLPEFSLM
jgi:undecaprenyl-diphosphatase